MSPTKSQYSVKITLNKPNLPAVLSSEQQKNVLMPMFQSAKILTALNLDLGNLDVHILFVWIRVDFMVKMLLSLFLINYSVVNNNIVQCIKTLLRKCKTVHL